MARPDLFDIAMLGPRQFYLSGELDISGLAFLERTIGPEVDRGGLVTLDVSALTFIDAQGIHGLLALRDRLPNGCLVLHGVRGPVERLFELIGLPWQERGWHVLGCTDDPFPSGGEEIGSPAKLVTMREGYLRLQRTVEAERSRTTDLHHRAEAARISTRQLRTA